MFINELNKKEAVAFLSLVKKLAEIDNAFLVEEFTLIKEYVKELNLVDEDYELVNLSDAFENFDNSNSRIKTIVYFELLGLALVDGKYDKEEIKFLNYVASLLNISKDKQESCLNYFKDIKTAYDSIVDDYENQIDILKKKAEDIVS